MNDASVSESSASRGHAPLPQAPVRADDLLDSVSSKPLDEQLDTLERIADVLGSDLGKAR